MCSALRFCLSVYADLSPRGIVTPPVISRRRAQDAFPLDRQQGVARLHSDRAPFGRRALDGLDQRVPLHGVGEVWLEAFPRGDGGGETDVCLRDVPRCARGY